MTANRLQRLAIASLALVALSPAQALQPGQVVEVPVACVAAHDAVAFGTMLAQTSARPSGQAYQTAGERSSSKTVGLESLGRDEARHARAFSCIASPGIGFPAYLLHHVTGPHGNASAWWSIWRARVGRALAFVVVRDWAL